LLEKLGGGTFALPTHTDHTPADIEHTGKAYDLALHGDGFFQVRKGDDVLYTRDGRFAVNQANQLVTATSHLPVLDQNGQPLTVDPAIPLFTVTETGLISQGENIVGQLGVVRFDDVKSLRKEGANLFTHNGSDTSQPSDALIKQEYLERSSVNQTSELVEMIQAQRLFETNLSMLRMQDQTMSQLINQVAGRS
jgi:flagellar basal body rod protein FlgG